MTRAGGGCAGPGERRGAHRRLVIRPGPRAAAAGATREMLAGEPGTPGGAVAEARAAAAAAPARPDCGLGLPQSGSLKGPRPLALGWRSPRLRPQARVGGARRPRVGPTSPRWNFGLGGGSQWPSSGGGLRWEPESSPSPRGPGVCGSRTFPASHRPRKWGEVCESAPAAVSALARHVTQNLSQC